jgi:tetratricopeptide (TPR) repeat protein
MASRVNTRFVIILIVAVIALLGMLIVAYSVAIKSPADLIRLGDGFMAQGDYRQAERAYSKSVNKDSSNSESINKWVEAMEHIVPETQTEYSDRFYTDYIGAVRRASTILRRDIDAHERFLKLRHEMLKSRYSRPLADAMIEESGGSYAYFTSAIDNGVEPWERLKRYRGLAIVEIARKGGVLEDDQLILAQDDLERTLEADPTDADSLVGLTRIKLEITNRTKSELDVQARIDTLKDSLAMMEDFLASNPNNVLIMMQQVLYNADIRQREISIELEEAEQRAAIIAYIQSLDDDISHIAELILGEEKDQLNIEIVQVFTTLESTISRQSKFARSRQLVDELIKTQKDDAEILWISGRVSKENNDYEEALGWFSQINDLQTKPLSWKGLLQYNIQTLSLLQQANIKVEQAFVFIEQSPDGDQSKVVANAIASRDRYAQVVSEDNGSLTLLNGKIARLEGDPDEALRLFKQFNEQTERNNTEGLWQEGITASQLNQFGIAKKALTELIAIDRSSRNILARLTLAQIDMGLQNYESAQQIFKDVLDRNPDLVLAQNGLDEVNRLLNPMLNEDPVLVAFYTSRQLRLGTEDAPGDLAGAIQFLQEAVVDLDYAPQISIELSTLLLDSNDIEGARRILEQAASKYPEDESLQNMASAIDSGDTTDILIAMVRNSSREPIDKYLSMAAIASSRDRPEVFDESVAELQRLAPSDKRVLELVFVQALRSGDLDTAKSIADRPDISQVDSLSYRARIAITEESSMKAIELLEQATSSGVADAAVFQMLAVLQRESGRLDDAIESFEQALEIRPDNSQTITEYILTLISANRAEESLNTARRLQRYGSSNPTFMNVWLNLESLYGGENGRDFAIRQRERMLELNPTDVDNRLQLARMYIASKQWQDARTLIDQLKSEQGGIELVVLDATWYADQGTFENRSGLIVANEIFAQYIDTLPAPVGPEAFIANSEFMLSRGRPDLAVIAANEAVKRQTTDTMLGSKLLGDLYLRINNLSEAVKAYQDVIDNDADSDFRIRNRLIGTLARLERYEEAQTIYQQLPDELKTDMVTMIQAADIAQGLGNNEEAGKILDDAVARYPTNPYVYVKRAETMVGDETLFNDMLSDLDRAIDLQADDWRAYRVRAAGYFAIDRKEDALDDLRTTVRLNPNLDKSVFAVLNELLLQDGRAGEAMDIAREVVSRRPDDAILMAKIGGIFASRDEWARASEMYKLAWDKRKGIGDGAAYIDSLVRMSRPDITTANAVISDLAARVGDINENPGLLAAQALVLQAQGRDDFGQQQITKAFDISADKDSDLINWSGNVTRYYEGQDADRQVLYLEALKRRNTNPDVQAWLDLFIARKLVNEAIDEPKSIEILERLKSYTSNAGVQVRAYRIMGSMHFNQDRFQEAVDTWKAGLSEFSDDWEMNNNVAYVLSSELGQHEEALSYGQLAVEKNDSRSEAYETLARIYIELGRLDEAEELISTGFTYVQTIPSQISMLITSGRLAIKRENLVEARSSLINAKTVIRNAPEAYPDLVKDVEEFEQELDSAAS